MKNTTHRLAKYRDSCREDKCVNVRQRESWCCRLEAHRTSHGSSTTPSMKRSSVETIQIAIEVDNKGAVGPKALHRDGNVLHSTKEYTWMEGVDHDRNVLDSIKKRTNLRRKALHRDMDVLLSIKEQYLIHITFHRTTLKRYQKDQVRTYGA